MSASPSPSDVSPEPRFEVDAMLVKLARYLRCLGYDATWDLGRPLAQRIDRADIEGRIFLTRSQRLAHQERSPLAFVIVQSDDPVEQVREVSRAIDPDTQPRLFTRCIQCNVALIPRVKDESIRVRVHAATFENYERFFGCPTCNTVFWKGTHVRNTCRKLGLSDASEGADDVIVPLA